MATSKKKKITRKSVSLTDYLKNTPHFSWKKGNNDVLAVGTAHISARSVEDVKKVFHLYKPDLTAVELCKPRWEALIDPDRWKRLDINQVIRQKKIWLLFSSLILSAFQKKIGKEMGVEPGAEMKTAIRLAEKHTSKLALVDREIRITLARSWAQIGFFSRIWLFHLLLASLLVKGEDIQEEQIEELKSRDILEDLLASLPPKYHSIRKVILDERDEWMAESIRRELKKYRHPKSSRRKKTRLLLVAGAAHLKGIEKNLKSRKSINLNKLMNIPRRSSWVQVLYWVIPTMVIFAIGTLFYRQEVGVSTIRELAISWILTRGIGAGVGALISLSHPITIIVTIVTAPLSYFLAFTGLRLWMISSLCEVRFKKPRVEDFENIASDTESFKGFLQSLYKNRVIHLAFLIFSISMGLAVGSLLFLKIAAGIIF